jgi:hypothetical protein
MPPFFKKRRRGNAGPNKNEKKVRRAQDATRLGDSLGLIQDAFPQVQSLTLQLEFITPENQLMDEETRTLAPTDPCDFSAPCPGRCGGSTPFDFSGKVKAMVNNRQTEGEANGTCQQPLYAGSPDVCGMRLKCSIEASYNE